ncbi:hybrid sensor histidine kinase/response regulator [Dokdonella immobilis]|uniref:histidine kinase n=1 Tax=Dokdonella immobilis TaxID=578942 RepID=A0A1I4WC64_9GAMM|nr:ATP-binding protein [Dokdonella immobilis]SFN11268.1 Signal transduction histidine kinase [Dokdonella immobilis]
MKDAPELADFSPEVERHIARFLFERAQPLLLEFDSAWHLINLQGDANRFGFDVDNAQAGARQLQDLFIGLSHDESVDLPFVQMPNGRSAHVHLLVAGDGYRVLLLDAQGEHDRQQAQQQTSNEASLIGYQKGKAIAQLRQIRSELEQQRARLQDANALKNALIATLSHDFRTPLTSVFGYLHLLETRVEPEPDAETRHALRAIRRNANYLFTLAENLLEYARADTRSSLLAPVETDLQAMQEDLDGMFRPLAVEQGLDFGIELERVDETTPVLDELRVRQILVNLISNAVRYTHHGEVKARLAWKDAALLIEVRDTGIGIGEDYRERVFEPFNKVGQAAGSGAGLGLSIVKRLVRQMHGTLDLQSTLGKGSRFRIVLPGLALAKPADAPLLSSDAAGGTQQRVRSVLVVDDDPDITHLLEVMLTDLGFRVRSVGEATLAVEQALANPPDVLLVDVELPGLSGNTAVFRLRAKGYRGHIVTLSATPTEEARKVALNAGANQYLTKPINIDQLARAMQRAVSAA